MVKITGLRADDTEREFGEFAGVVLTDGRLVDLVTDEVIVANTPSGWQTERADKFTHVFVQPVVA